MTDANTPEQSTWTTLSEAAEAVGVSTMTIRRAVKAGKIAGQKGDGPADPWHVRLSDVQAQWGTGTAPPASDADAAIELKSLFDDHRRMLHDLQDAYKAEAIATAKAEHLGERIVEVRADRDEVKEERDKLMLNRARLIAENAALRNRRWWQRKANM
jgi:excisionase family DNA binding protein